MLTDINPDRCSAISRAHGEDPTGWAVVGQRILLFELPLPWAGDLHLSRHLPPGPADFVERWEDSTKLRIQALVPDPAYTPSEMRRVILFTSPGSGALRYTKHEYLVPQEELGGVLRALEAGEDPSRWQVASGGRDIVVCTHGTHDTCCGSLGTRLYQSLREQYGDQTRVWRGSHTGGHRFAPTLIDLPDGRSWGPLDPASAAAVIERETTPDLLTHRYRGWAALRSFHERVAEAGLFRSFGWEWINRRASFQTVDGEDIIYPEDPDAIYTDATVDVTHSVYSEPSTVHRVGVVFDGWQLTRGDCTEPPLRLPRFHIASLEAAGR